MSILAWLKSIEDRFERGINRDESVVFYPSYGYLSSDGTWKLEVRGTISEKREVLRKLPKLALALTGVEAAEELGGLLGELADDAEAIRFFQERSAPFLLDGESGEHFEIELDRHRFPVGPSSSVGFVEETIALPTPTAAALAADGGNPWISYTAADNDRERFFTGQSQLLQPTGVTVVSDIDDTIKVSNVVEPAELLLNSLFRAFREVEGMPELYQDWSRQGADFVYVTNSPYQLFEPLARFLQQLYPAGGYYMRRIDWNETRRSIDRLVAVDEQTTAKESGKKYTLIPMLERFRRRRFILVGDSGERDAEIYADLFLGRDFPDRFDTRSYGEQIAKIYIRDVPGSRRRAEAEAAVAAVNARREGVARLFEDPEEIRADALEVFAEPATETPDPDA